jgi:cbb3-type cytochrome oxidase maturation protein
VPLSLVLLVAAIWAFVWAVRRDQFEDLDAPAISILFDDDDRPTPARTRVAAAAPASGSNALAVTDAPVADPSAGDPPVTDVDRPRTGGDAAPEARAGQRDAP